MSISNWPSNAKNRIKESAQIISSPGLVALILLSIFEYIGLGELIKYLLKA